MNQLRGMLLERGILVPQGRRKLETYPDALVIGEPVPLSTRIAPLIADMRAEWRGLDRRIAEFDSEFAKRARDDDAARRLATIPGIGVLNATALASAVGRAQTFGRGRDRAAWLGVVPKQPSTGGKPRLLGISKRATCICASCWSTGRVRRCRHCRKAKRRSARRRGLLSRVHTNLAVVALANKLARFAWAVLRTDRSFETKTVAATG